MAWLKLDDKGHSHAKVLAAGNEAYGAWVRAGQWSCDHLTDGFVPQAVAFSFAPAHIWERLADVGLLDPVDGGWVIHDFLVYNPSASEVRAERGEHSQKRREAGRKGGARSAEVRRAKQSEANGKQTGSKREATAQANTEANAKQNEAPYPYPYPEDLDHHVEPQPETLEPPPVPTAAAGAPAVPEAKEGVQEPSGGPISEPDDPQPTQDPIDASWLAKRLTAAVFRPLASDAGLLDDLAGRIAMAGVRPEEVERAIDEYALKGDLRGSGKDLARGLASFVSHAKTRRRAAEQPMHPNERDALDLWVRLWSKEHNGAAYPFTEVDKTWIKKLTARATERARVIGGGVRVGDVLTHYFAGYLRIDDKRLVADRYPLPLLESRLTAIGEYEVPRAHQSSPAAISDPPPSSRPRPKEPLPNLVAMLAEERAKAGGKLVARPRP